MSSRSLSQAANALAELYARIDEGGELDEALEEMFKSDSLAVAEAVSRRINFLQFLKRSAEESRQKSKLWAQRARVLESTEEKITQYTEDVLRSNPNVPFLSLEDGELTLQKVGGLEKLEIDIPLAGASLSNVVDTHDPLTRDIDFRYLKTVSYTVLDVDVLRGDLVRKVKIPWARLLPRGEHLRIRI